MLTIEVYNTFVTWPKDVALIMVAYYRKAGVSVVIHRRCVVHIPDQRRLA